MNSTFTKILVATDNSEPAQAAAATALRLARESGAEMVFANAIDTQVVVDLEELAKDESRALLAEAQRPAAEAGVKTATEILIGRLAPTLTSFAKECGADLIAMGTHARHGIERFVLGSEVVGVLHAARVPVLAVRTAPAEGAGVVFARLLVALDDSDAAQAACALAIRYAQATGAEVVFSSVVDADAIVRNASVYGFDPKPIVGEARDHAEQVLAEAVERARTAGVAVGHSVTESAHTAQGILEAAAESSADAIVVGTHGRRGLRHLLLGSVAEAVVENSTIPVFVTR